MATVYLDTTIPSLYVDKRRSSTIATLRETTQRWWQIASQNYDLCTSMYVHAELALAPREQGAAALALISKVRQLEDLPAITEIAEHYIEHRLMPRESGGDATHLAMASYHGCDFLLTWNCRHLANANKARHLSVLNGRLGLPVPMITTPFNLMPEET